MIRRAVPGRWHLLGAAAVAAAAALVVAGPAARDTRAADPAAKPATTRVAAQAGGKGDHVMFGGDHTRNMVNLTAKLPDLPVPGPDWGDSDEAKESVKKWTADWVLWKADLGSRAYGGPTVAGGKIFVGTNNERPRNPDRDQERNKDGEVKPVDKGILMCFDEKTGKFLWQAVHDKLAAGNVNDWPHEGVCATPTVEGNRVYYVSNRCTVMCLDADGFANGNQGLQTEKYKSDTDADVIWQYDMMKELNVFPHNMSACCPLIVGDVVYVVTANGVDEGHINLPSPEAPSFIALDKNTGKLLWKKSYPGRNIMHGQWSNPVYAEFGGVRQVVFPGGDGWLYGLVPETGDVIWKFDANPKDAVYELGGAGTRNDFIGTPVLYDNKLYIGVGQDPEHTTGVAWLWCIDPAGKKGDVSDQLPWDGKRDADGKAVVKPNPNTAKVWVYGGEEKRPFSNRDFRFGRTMCTASIVDDILYLGEVSGQVHCLNAKTGKHYWQYDTTVAFWGSTYYVDGKVLIGNDNGDLHVFRHDKHPEVIDDLDPNAATQKAARAFRKKKEAEVAQKYLIAKIPFDAAIRSTPVVANDVLYIMTEKSLFALRTTKK